MARLHDIIVDTQLSSVQDLLESVIPKNDVLELSKYLQDAHTLLYKLLQAEKIRNPSTRSRFLHVQRGSLIKLRAAWENYLFDYYDQLQARVVVGKQSVCCFTLFWRNFFVLNSLIIRRKYGDAFPYVSARDMDYARKQLLCVSRASIGEYKMSELLSALRTMSWRKWSLPWGQGYVDYLLQLEWAVSERVTWLAEEGGEGRELYDEGCSRAQDRPYYGVSTETVAWVGEWFYEQKKRTRMRMRLQKWLQPESSLSVPLDVVERLRKLLRETARMVHDVALFLRPMKGLVLKLAVREGEKLAYQQLHGNKSGSDKDVLREFRPVNYMAHIEDELLDVPNVLELLDSPLQCMKKYQELLQLYLINQLFAMTDGFHFPTWMRYYVCFELDLGKNLARVKRSNEPLLLQSFTDWYLYYEKQIWKMPDVATAFVAWAICLREKRDSTLRQCTDISPLLDKLFLSPSSYTAAGSESESSSEQEEDEGLDFVDVSGWI